MVKTTCGRVIFNNAIPQNIGLTPRVTEEDYCNLEVNHLVKKGDLKKIVNACFKTGGSPLAAEALDSIKALGYKYSTIAALTTSVFDMHIPDKKDDILNKAEQEVLRVEKLHSRGLLTEDEGYKKVVELWTRATDDISEEIPKSLDKFNPIQMMVDSGARGSKDQVKQLVGMRGLMSDPNGKTIEIPVKSCFREGLSVLEYFISSHGGRKGLADTALKTADSGYLTRRLVDVSHNVIIREEDCFEGTGEKPQGVWITSITSVEGGKKKEIESLEDRLAGRFTIDAVCYPEGHEKAGQVIVEADSMISEEQAKEITKAGIEKVLIRSIFTCRSKNGVCSKCYGKNMSNNLPVNIGEAVGIIAAQSIGEPGTQLTMRTFHTGGIASDQDITAGLPRIEELFEARRPKGQAIVCENEGIVTIEENKEEGLRHIVVKGSGTGKDATKDYAVPFNAGIKVKNGDAVEPGTILTSGSVYPQDVLKAKGAKGVQDYILHEVQSVYRSQGVDINDKHVEIIVRQMLRKVRIEKCGDTDMLPGEMVDITRFEAENLKAMNNGKAPATAKRVLLGITKASLATESFLSAASFQETARVLTEAAIKNKVDPLLGLKENVIIGKLIPAGTGVKDYKLLNPQLNN